MSSQKKLSEEELIKEVERLKKSVKNKRFGLVWQNIPEAFDEIAENKLPTLKEIAEKSIIKNKDKTAHVLIEGDNYHALTCLNYTHKNKIDVIFIDPPYNTGKDGFRYKDKRIIKVFPDGTEVPKDHPFRHSYWLSFMHKRLELMRNLLSDKGVIFISIGDDEFAQLKLLCDQVFGKDNFVANVLWKKKTNANNMGHIPSVSDYILVYSKTDNPALSDILLDDSKAKSGYTNPDNDPRGPWTTSDLSANHVGPYFEITNPSTGEKHLPPSGRYWVFNEKEVARRIEDGRIIFGKSGNAKPVQKKFLSEASNSVKPDNWWADIALNSEGTKEIERILGPKKFVHPKPVRLIKHILKIAGDENSIILDCFAGSGTTGHAVMELNAETGSNRQWIMVTNNEDDIMNDVCYPRIQKVINGYSFQGDLKEEIFSQKITTSNLQSFDLVLAEANKIRDRLKSKWDTFEEKVSNNKFIVYGKKSVKETVEGLNASVRYYRTDFVGSNYIFRADDNDVIELAKNAGALLALAEGTLNQEEASSHYQFFNGNNKITAVYFREELEKYMEFIEKIRDARQPVTVYVFSWGDSTFVDDFSGMPNVTVKTIPKPILEIYKSIYNLEID